MKKTVVGVFDNINFIGYGEFFTNAGVVLLRAGCDRVFAGIDEKEGAGGGKALVAIVSISVSGI